MNIDASQLTKVFSDAQKVLSKLDGDIGTIKFDPFNEQSVNAAIREVNSLVDDKVRPNGNNPLVKPIVEAAKKKFTTSILRRSEEKRELSQREVQ